MIQIESITHLRAQLNIVTTSTCMFILQSTTQIQTIFLKTITEQSLNCSKIGITLMTIAKTTAYHPVVSNKIAVARAKSKAELVLLIAKAQTGKTCLPIMCTLLKLSTCTQREYCKKQCNNKLFHNHFQFLLIIILYHVSSLIPRAHTMHPIQAQPKHPKPGQPQATCATPREQR